MLAKVAPPRSKSVQSETSSCHKKDVYMSIERDIFHEAEEVKEELCQEAKSRRHLLQNQIISGKGMLFWPFSLQILRRETSGINV